ncbi:hypothetical protein A4X09_0g4120, partial [Tilletia walkeri]
DLKAEAPRDRAVSNSEGKSRSATWRACGVEGIAEGTRDRTNRSSTGKTSYTEDKIRSATWRGSVHQDSQDHRDGTVIRRGGETKASDFTVKAKLAGAEEEGSLRYEGSERWDKGPPPTETTYASTSRQCARPRDGRLHGSSSSLGEGESATAVESSVLLQSRVQEDPRRTVGKSNTIRSSVTTTRLKTRQRSAVLRRRLNGYLRAVRQCARAAQYNPDGDGQNRASKAPSPGRRGKTTVSKLTGIPDPVGNSVLPPLPVPPRLEAPSGTYTIGAVRDPPLVRFRLRGPTEEKE